MNCFNDYQQNTSSFDFDYHFQNPTNGNMNDCQSMQGHLEQQTYSDQSSDMDPKDTANTEQQSKQPYHWNQTERRSYEQFCYDHFIELTTSNKYVRKDMKIFLQMSLSVKTRNPNQCKSHHQKCFRRLKQKIMKAQCMSDLPNHYKNDDDEDDDSSNFSSIPINDNQTQHCQFQNLYFPCNSFKQILSTNFQAIHILLIPKISENHFQHYQLNQQPTFLNKKHSEMQNKMNLGMNYQNYQQSFCDKQAAYYQEIDSEDVESQNYPQIFINEFQPSNQKDYLSKQSTPQFQKKLITRHKKQVSPKNQQAKSRKSKKE